MSSMFRTILLKALLIAALLFVQQGAAMHGVAHALAEQKQEQSLPHDHACELCAAYAQVGSAIGSSEFKPDLAAPCSQPHDPARVAVHATSFAAFAARAPPAA